jgi:phage shock protein A
MNIFTRLWQIIKANVNAFIDRVEKPEQLLEQSIRDMQKQVQRVRSDVINVIAAEKKLKAQVDQNEKDIAKWEKNAMLALKSGKEDLAVEALRRKKEAAEFFQQLQPQWEKQAAISAKLKDEYTQLRRRIEDAQRKKQNLIMRLTHAETQKRLQGLLGELTDGQVFEKFDNKVSNLEAMNAAQQELYDNSIERKFEALGSSDLDVEQELAALKERIKLNP